MVEGEKVGCYDGEICVERDGGEVYGSYGGLVAGDAGEGTWVFGREPIMEERWVRERLFEVEK